MDVGSSLFSTVDNIFMDYFDQKNYLTKKKVSMALSVLKSLDKISKEYYTIKVRKHRIVELISL